MSRKVKDTYKDTYEELYHKEYENFFILDLGKLAEIEKERKREEDGTEKNSSETDV